MNNPCQHITQAIDIALLAGNELYPIENKRNEYGNYIIDMYDPLTQEVKKQIDKQCGDLEYRVSKDSHNPVVSYKCNKCKVVLFFPTSKDPRPLYRQR